MSQGTLPLGPNTHRLPLIIISVIFTSLGTLIVLARLFVRGISTKTLGKDDYAILAAWFASIGFTASSSVALYFGMGQFEDQTSLKHIQDAIEAAFYIEIFYYFAIFLIKVSILLFYLRLVDGIRPTFYYGIISCLALVVLHFISTIVVVFLQCQPISFYWNQNQIGSCVNITQFFYSTNGFTIASDLIILALPIPTLSQIKRTPIQKIALISVFGAGAFSTIASCIRLYTIRIYTTSKDPLYDAAPITFWSFIEINLGMACASGPALKVLLKQLKNNLTGSNTSKAPTVNLRSRSRSQAHDGGSEIELRPRLSKSHSLRDGDVESVYEYDSHTRKLKKALVTSDGRRPSDVSKEMSRNNEDVF